MNAKVFEVISSLRVFLQHICLHFLYLSHMLHVHTFHSPWFDDRNYCCWSTPSVLLLCMNISAYYFSKIYDCKINVGLSASDVLRNIRAFELSRVKECNSIYRDSSQTKEDLKSVAVIHWWESRSLNEHTETRKKWLFLYLEDRDRVTCLKLCRQKVLQYKEKLI
jgi:hypothetical protein